MDDKDVYNVTMMFKDEDASMLRYLMKYYRIDSAKQFLRFLVAQDYRRIEKKEKLEPFRLSSQSDQEDHLPDQ